MTAPFSQQALGRRSGLALPETAQWLIQGGDQRIELDALSGRNGYGCRPTPEPDLWALGSSTATGISEAGYQAAERLRLRLLASPGSMAAACAREGRRQTRELIQLLGLETLAPRVTLGASGTDLHRQAAAMAGAGEKSLGSVMVEDAETGRGVGQALAGPSAAIHRLRLRNDHGQPRDQGTIDDEATMAVEALLQHHDHCLLVMTDLSKTGLMAPSPRLAATLQAQYAGRVTVLVDACQMRLTPATLRHYLAQGFWVVITGSKFLSGPSFSGALLLPGDGADEFRERMAMASDPGLLLRWEAALAELRAFAALSDGTVKHTLAAFAQCTREQLEKLPFLAPLAVPRLHRQNPGWDCEQSIFPLVPLGPDKRPLPLTAARHLNRCLMTAYPDWEHTSASVRVQLGQPVACGYGHGQPAHALRLCASARLVVQASQEGLAPMLGQLRSALEKANWLAGRIAEF